MVHVGEYNTNVVTYLKNMVMYTGQNNTTFMCVVLIYLR